MGWALLAAEIVAMTLDDIATGIAYGDLDAASFAELPAAGEMREVRMQRRLSAIQAVGFLKGPHGEQLCDDLGVERTATYIRIRQLAEEKRPYALMMLDREARRQREMREREEARRETFAGQQAARAEAVAAGQPLPEVARVETDGELRRSDGRRQGRPGRDLTGTKLGRLTVLCRGSLRGKIRCWQVRCSCEAGTVKELASHVILAGRVQSCGCLLREIREKGKANQRRLRLREEVAA